MYEDPVIPVKLINMKMIFDAETIDLRLSIDSVSQNDMNIVERSNGDKNIIQISTVTDSLMWDLDSNSEIICVSGYD